ncbi:MAG: hypothetical protein ACKV2T_42770 [Kofleriaceae bacterium]
MEKMSEAADDDTETIASEYIRAAGIGGAAYARARSAVATASQAQSDRMAAYYARRIARGDHEVCAVLANQLEPMWFASGRSLLLAAAGDRPECATLVHCLKYGPIRRDVENAGLARRLASVFTRAWVIGFVWIPLPFVVIAAVTVESSVARAVLSAVVVAILGLTLFIDARMRRCPTCKRWLAGMVTGLKHGGSWNESVVVETTRGPQQMERSRSSYIHLMVCVHCKHRWER